jgi:fatty acid desaturase
MGSANYHCGGEFTDYMSCWLNYQIEHHLFPDLPPKKLQQAQPRVEAICKQHGVPYVREPIAQRVKQLVGVMVGTRSMRRAKTGADAATQIDATRMHASELSAIAAEE